MENAILIFPNNKEDSSLYKQLAKRLHNKVEIKREKKDMDTYFENKENIKEIEKGIKEMKEGKVTRIKDANSLWESIS